MRGLQAAAALLALLLHGVDSESPQASLRSISMHIEPEVACPEAQFNVIWENQQARVTHWLGVFLDNKLLYWCFLDGTQTQPLDLGTSTGVGLMIGTAGTYSIHYFAVPRPKGTTSPVLMQDAIGVARVTISSAACFELRAHPATNCELDPFELSWRIPSGQLGEGDRVGIFRAQDGAPVPGLPAPPPPPAIHWVSVTQATDKKVLRIGKPGQYQARFFFGTAPTVPDIVSEIIQIVPRSDPGCGDYVAVLDSATTSPIAAASSTGTASLQDVDSAPPPSLAKGGLPPPLMMILHPTTAIPSSRSIRIPDANLGSRPMDGVGIMLWIMLLEDATGKHRSLVYKGIGNDHRTPSIWLLPSTNQLTFQLSTTRTNEDAAISRTSLPLCAWTHIAFVIEGNNAKLYLNGSVDSSRMTMGTPLYNNGTLTIGSEGSFAGPRALLQRVQYRPHSISADEVAEEYAAAGVDGGVADLPPLPSEVCPARERSVGASGVTIPIDANDRYALGTELLNAPRMAPPSPAPGQAAPASAETDKEKQEQEAAQPALPIEGILPATDGDSDNGKVPAIQAAPPPMLRNAPKALEQFQLAEPHPASMLAAAKLLFFGEEGIEADAVEARKYFLKAYAAMSNAAADWASPATLQESTVAAAAEAARFLGMMSLAGKGGVAIDTALGESYLRVAAAGGDPVAQLALGYRARIAGQDSCMASAYYYRWAAQKTYSDVHTDKKTFLIDKTRISTDWVRPAQNLETGQRGEDDELIQYHMMQAQTGDVAALTNIGDLYYYGARGMPRDLPTSFDHYQRAADSGDSGALAKVGSMYQKGEGVPQNYTKSVEAFKASARLNDAKGHNGLAYMHYYGRGVPQNYTAALDSFEAAALAGNSDAMYNAGLMHKEGRGTSINSSAAEKHFLSASQHGHFDAIFMLGGMYLMGELEDQKISCPTAQHYYKMAGEYGEWGQDIRKGFDAFLAGKHDTALVYYEIAAELGYEVAMSNAAYIYDNGFIKQNELTSVVDALPGQHALNDAAENRDQVGELASRTVSTASDVRAKRLLLMAQQEGSSSAALRLGDYAFYGYGRDRGQPPLGSSSPGELEQSGDEQQDGGGLAVHQGIRCDASGMFPILGNRWHKTGEDFDLCDVEYQKLTEAEQSKFELVELVPVKEGVDYAAAMAHYRTAAERGVSQAAYSLGYMYEWGYGTEVDEAMAEHFYRKAIAQAEQGQNAADKAEPVSLYFTGALLKLHARQHLREGWTTAAGLQGRLEEFWAETIAPALARQGFQLSVEDSEVQAAAVLFVVLAGTILWRTCCANSLGELHGTEQELAEEPRDRDAWLEATRVPSIHGQTGLTPEDSGGREQALTEEPRDRDAQLEATRVPSGHGQTGLTPDVANAAEADPTGNPSPTNSASCVVSTGANQQATPSSPDGQDPQEHHVGGGEQEQAAARDRDARLAAALRRQQQQQQQQE